MSYYEKTKLEGEVLIKKCEKSNFFYLWPTLIFVVGGLYGFVVPEVESKGALGMLGIGLFINWCISTMQYHVTNQRVISSAYFGLYNKDLVLDIESIKGKNASVENEVLIRRLKFRKLGAVKIEQSFLGKQFGFGTLRVEADIRDIGADVTFPFVKDPIEVKRLILEQCE